MCFYVRKIEGSKLHVARFYKNRKELIKNSVKYGDNTFDIKKNTYKLGYISNFKQFWRLISKYYKSKEDFNLSVRFSFLKKV